MSQQQQQRSSFHYHHVMNYPFDQQDEEYTNNRNTINYLIERKSPIQQMNQRIMQVTSDIKQHKMSRIKNHQTHHNNILHYQSSPSYKSSIKISSSPSQQYNKINYKQQSAYFNHNHLTPFNQKNNFETFPSKVNFFYDNPVQISGQNNEVLEKFNKNYNPIYHQAYQSTDLILQSYKYPSLFSYEQKDSITKRNIKFNYINQQQKQHQKPSSKSSISYIHKLQQQPKYSQPLLLTTQKQKLQTHNNHKSYKRTKSYEDLLLKLQKQRKKQSKQDIFYDMNQTNNFKKHTTKSSQSKQQNNINKALQQQKINKPKMKVITTRISQQKSPHILSELLASLNNKGSQLIIAIVLIALAIGIFLIQLIS